jgi:hypothetical protein
VWATTAVRRQDILIYQSLTTGIQKDFRLLTNIILKSTPNDDEDDDDDDNNNDCNTIKNRSNILVLPSTPRIHLCSFSKMIFSLLK